MKWSATISALIVSVASFVAAQQDAGVYFTNPVLGTILNAGAPTSIQWTVTSSNVTTIDTMELRNGNAENLALVQTLLNQPIQLSVGKYDWVIPSNISTDTSYVILARNSAGTSYSAYFTIMGLAPGVTANDFATTTTTAAVVSSSPVVSESASPVVSSTAPVVSSIAPAVSSTAAPVITTAAPVSSVATASSSAAASSGSVSVNQANAVSGSNSLKAGMMGVAGAAAAAAVLLA